MEILSAEKYGELSFSQREEYVEKLNNYYQELDNKKKINEKEIKNE